MRVLIVNNYARITGGADLHCQQLAAGLTAIGHEVRWLASRAPDEPVPEGAFVKRLVDHANRAELSPAEGMRVARNALWNSESWSATNRILNDFRPDVVHVHKAYVQLSVAPVFAASRAGVPIVQTVHDYEFMSASPQDSTGRAWDHDEARLAYRVLNSATWQVRKRVHAPRITRWIAVSESVARRYRETAGIDSVVLPNFVIPPKDEIPEDGQRNGVVYIGRLSEEKGIRYLLEAARLTPGVEWRIYGHGALEQEVRWVAGQLSNVFFGGALDSREVNAALQEAEIAVIPSTWEEPGPLSCLEAMANGTPVVCFARGGLAEYVEMAGNGVVCQEAEPRALADAVLDLIEDKASRRRMSTNGLRAVEVRHSLDNYLERLVAEYAEATGRAG